VACGEYTASTTTTALHLKDTVNWIAYFVRLFRGNVDCIRTSSSAEASVIVTRQMSPLKCFKPATVTEIINLLKNSLTKSCDLDPIPTWLLKRVTPNVAPAICRLCNLSMESGVFPTQWKQARVVPLLKKLNNNC